MNKRSNGVRCQEGMSHPVMGTSSIGPPQSWRGNDVKIISYDSPFVYYESLQREVKTKPINECRCDERLIDEMFPSEMGEYVFLM